MGYSGTAQWKQAAAAPTVPQLPLDLAMLLLGVHPRETIKTQTKEQINLCGTFIQLTHVVT